MTRQAAWRATGKRARCPVCQHDNQPPPPVWEAGYGWVPWGTFPCRRCNAPVRNAGGEPAADG